MGPDGKSSRSDCDRPLQGDADFSGPVASRTCTDWWCVVIFVVLNMAFIALCGYCYSCGEPDRLIHGWDFRGELCGTGELAHRAYTFFPIPKFSLDVGLCLEGCPVLSTQYSVCYYGTDHHTDMTSLPCYSSYLSKPYFNRYCLPSDSATRDIVLSWLSRPQQVTSRIVGDIRRAWDVLALTSAVMVCGAVAVVLWLYTGRLIGVLGIIALAALVISMACACFFVYAEADRTEDRICATENGVEMEDCDSEVDRGYAALSISLGALSFVALVALVVQVRKAFPGAELLALATQPLRNSLWLLGLYLSVLLVGAAVYTFSISAIVSAASCGSIDTIVTIIPGYRAKRVEFNDSTRGSIVFILLMLCWWLSLLVHCVEYVVSFYTVTWFFSKDKAKIDQPIRTALWTLFRYHFGSVLLSSLALPLVRPLRTILRLLHDAKGLMNSDLEKCYASCCGLCLEGYAQFVRFLNSQILPYQALWGTSYLESAKRGWYLIARGDPKSLDPVHAAEVHLWVYQLAVALLSPVQVYIWVLHADFTVSGEATLHITSAMGLAGTSLIFSWFVSEALGGFVRGLIYGEVVSYLADKEMFAGVQRFSDISFSHMFREDLTPKPPKKEEVVHPILTEESQQDLLDSVHYNKVEYPQGKPEILTLSSQISFFSETSDGESLASHPHAPMQRMNSLVDLDTVRNLEPPATVPLPGVVAEELSARDSVSSFGESENEFRQEPVARPPSRGELRRQESLDYAQRK